MGRIITIAVILLLILAVSLLGVWYAKDTHVLMEEKITLATKACRENDLVSLSAITSELKELWEQRERLLSFYVRHDEIEKINMDLVNLSGCIETGSVDSALLTLRQIEFLSAHFYELELPNWDNIL